MFYFLLLTACLVFAPRVSARTPAAVWWPVQSIDTMKYSRDLSREKLSDSGYASEIDSQVARIAATGATHVAIGTPYDSEFYPFLSAWVKSARKHNLNVWFRGNFSGWEGWFGYPPIGEQALIDQTTQFITRNSALFADGDIFSPCPECENGGTGDPRETGDVAGFRQLLISLFTAANRAFAESGKSVQVYFSHNGDVARLIMDPPTTNALGGVVVVDHYVADPGKLAADLTSLAAGSGGKIILGEFGAPIPNIHGIMTPAWQATWLRETLSRLVLIPGLVGVNYWSHQGSSTALWNNNGTLRDAVAVLTGFYSPSTRVLAVKNVLDQPLKSARADYLHRTYPANQAGQIMLPMHPTDSSLIEISAPGYESHGLQATTSAGPLTIYLTNPHENILFKVLKLLFKIRRDIL